TNSTGQIVWLAPTQTVSAAVTGSVSVPGTPVVTGSVAVSGTVTALGGAASIPTPTTQAAQTGALVLLATTQTISGAVSGTVSGTVTVLTGTISVSSHPAISGTVSLTPVVATTTQVANTGLLVWIAPTQTVSAAVSGSVTVLTGTVSIFSMPVVTGSVSISGP